MQGYIAFIGSSRKTIFDGEKVKVNKRTGRSAMMDSWGGIPEIARLKADWRKPIAQGLRPFLTRDEQRSIGYK